MKILKPNAIILAFALLALGAGAEDAGKMLEEAETAYAPSEYRMVMEMVTFRPGKEIRALGMEVLYKKGLGSLMEMNSPARSKGIRILQKGQNLWMYNPRSGSKKAVRLSPRDSFQGSHFANTDLGDPQYSDDYDSEFGGRVELDHPELGKIACSLIEAKAKRDESPYGRIRMWILSDDSTPVMIEYYAKSGILFKKMTLSGLKNIAGRRRPTVMRMEAMDEEGAYTLVTVARLEAAPDMNNSVFSETYLTR